VHPFSTAPSKPYQHDKYEMIKKLPEAVCNTDPKTTIEGHNIFNFNNSIISNTVIDRLNPKKN
jgi:hypothetical protein